MILPCLGRLPRSRCLHRSVYLVIYHCLSTLSAKASVSSKLLCTNPRLPCSIAIIQFFLLRIFWTYATFVDVILFKTFYLSHYYSILSIHYVIRHLFPVPEKHALLLVYKVSSKMTVVWKTFFPIFYARLP